MINMMPIVKIKYRMEFRSCSIYFASETTNKKHTLSTLKQHKQRNKQKQEKNKINNKVLTGKEER